MYGFESNIARLLINDKMKEKTSSVKNSTKNVKSSVNNLVKPNETEVIEFSIIKH